MSTLTDRATGADGSTYRRTTPTLIQVICRSIWQALEREGQRRARGELRALAARHEPFDPGLARLLREASLFDAH